MARSTAQKVVSEAEHRSFTKDFLNIARDVSRREGWTEYDVFTKWLEAATCALRNPILKLMRQTEAWDKNEERYMKIVANCRHKQETMNDMSKMLAVCTMALEDTPKDFIGPVFMEVAASSGMGQFFTPIAVSELIARLTIPDAQTMLNDAYLKGQDFITFSEPACGVGGMVMATNGVLREQGVDIARETHWTCVDIDSRAVCGAFIQLNLTGSSALVVHGNCLSLEEWDHLYTLTAVLHPKRIRRSNVQLISHKQKETA